MAVSSVGRFRSDSYGFFHGWKFAKALHDYQLIGGKAIMVPKQAMD